MLEPRGILLSRLERGLLLLKPCSAPQGRLVFLWEKNTCEHFQTQEALRLWGGNRFASDGFILV